jgi:dynein heavy chain, axonemal
MFTMVHKSVEVMSTRFYEELRRKVYITPKSYLDGINMYISSLEKKRDEEKLNMDRLSNGCKKLKDTNAQISELQVSLADLIPRLDVENLKAAEKAEIIKANKQIAF